MLYVFTLIYQTPTKSISRARIFSTWLINVFFFDTEILSKTVEGARFVSFFVVKISLNYDTCDIILLGRFFN